MQKAWNHHLIPLPLPSTSILHERWASAHSSHQANYRDQLPDCIKVRILNHGSEVPGLDPRRRRSEPPSHMIG
jgi:hypothetical protein